MGFQNQVISLKDFLKLFQWEFYKNLAISYTDTWLLYLADQVQNCLPIAINHKVISD